MSVKGSRLVMFESGIARCGPIFVGDDRFDKWSRLLVLFNGIAYGNLVQMNWTCAKEIGHGGEIGDLDLGRW